MTKEGRTDGRKEGSNPIGYKCHRGVSFGPWPSTSSSLFSPSQPRPFPSSLVSPQIQSRPFLYRGNSSDEYQAVRLRYQDRSRTVLFLVFFDRDKNRARTDRSHIARVSLNGPPRSRSISYTSRRFFSSILFFFFLRHFFSLSFPLLENSIGIVRSFLFSFFFCSLLLFLFIRREKGETTFD